MLLLNYMLAVVLCAIAGNLLLAILLNCKLNELRASLDKSRVQIGELQVQQHDIAEMRQELQNFVEELSLEVKENISRPELEENRGGAVTELSEGVAADTLIARHSQSLDEAELLAALRDKGVLQSRKIAHSES